MNTIKMLTRQYIRDNRIKVVLFSLLVSLLSTLLITLFDKLHIQLIGLVTSTILVFYFFCKINTIVDIIVRGKEVKKEDFYGFPSISIKYLHAFLFYVVYALIAFIALYFGSKVQYLGIVILVLIIISLGLVTGIVSVYVGLDDSPLYAFKIAVKTVATNIKYLFSYLVKILSTVFQGAVLILCVNVFVFGPQLQETLAKPNVENSEILKYFTNSVGNFIQIVGAQTIVFYVLFVGIIFYKTYAIQKHLHKRR